MKRQLLALSLTVASVFNGFSFVQPAHAAMRSSSSFGVIAEQEPNDERSQVLGRVGLNQTIEVAGAFKGANDMVDHYKVEMLTNGSLTVKLKSGFRLLARVYQDRDSSGTVSIADQFVGSIQSGQSIKVANTGCYVIRVLKPNTMNGFSTYTLLLIHQSS